MFCMDSLYLRWPITHLLPIGEIGWTGNKSCNSLILPGVFTSLSKNSVISAFMGFIWRITIRRPRRWSSQRVKWEEGRRSDTQMLPQPPSVSSHQPRFLGESTAEFDPATLPPPKTPMTRPAEGTAPSDASPPPLSRNMQLLLWLSQLRSLTRSDQQQCISPLLRSLHWLQFKILTLAQSASHSGPWTLSWPPHSTLMSPSTQV